MRLPSGEEGEAELLPSWLPLGHCGNLSTILDKMFGEKGKCRKDKSELRENEGELGFGFEKFQQKRSKM